MMDYIDRTAVIEPPQKNKLLDYIAGLNVIVWKHVSMFFYCIYLTPLLKIICLYVCGFISGFSICSIGLVSIFLPVPCSFDYCHFVV